MPNRGLGRFRDALHHLAHPDQTTRNMRHGDDDGWLSNIFSSPFAVDTQKIIHSKAFRRLADKTQVFTNPSQPHVRTRMTHTNEVESVAVTISHALGLNGSFCRAIALGHDIGHAPYGHLGEQAITKFSGREFRHEVFSVVVAQRIERRGRGLNLSPEVLNGILAHSRGGRDLTMPEGLPMEYAAVMCADKIAYTFSDINDALRFHYLKRGDLPKEIFSLGKNQRQRVRRTILALIKESAEAGKIQFQKSAEAEQFHDIREWMFKNHYQKIDVRIQLSALESVYDFLSHDRFARGRNPGALLALLTDREMAEIIGAIGSGQRLKASHFDMTGLAEILPYIPKDIDFR
jgi:dGTPase